MSKMTHNAKQQLNRMVFQLCGTALDKDGKRVDVHEHTKKFLTDLASANMTPEQEAEAVRMLKAAIEDPKGADARSLNAMRVEQVTNFIRVNSNFMSAFFEQVTLADDEQPYIENLTKQQIRAGILSEEGQPDMARVAPNSSYTAVPLGLVASDKVTYKLTDIYKGNVAPLAEKTFDIGQDLTFKYDRMHFDLLTAAVASGGAFGAFTFTESKKADRIYVAHSGVKTAHLPTTNDYDMTKDAESTDNPCIYGNLDGFSWQVCQAVKSYADRWGNCLPDANGQRLIPTGEIIVPASDIENLALESKLSPNTSSNLIQEQIATQGYTSLTWMGTTWKFIPDLTIESGTCYPLFNLKVGKSYDKPSFNKEFNIQDPDKQNLGIRWQQRVFGAYIISQHRPRAMRIKYQ